jgi:hypothetical protein
MKCKFSKVQDGLSDDFKLEGLVFELALAARVETSHTEELLNWLLFDSSIFKLSLLAQFRTLRLPV